MAREGKQHWIKAQLIQRNINAGRSEARHLGGSVKQSEGDSALGDRRAKSLLLCKGEAQIELPEGDGGGPSSRQCGLLRKSLYGTCDAAQNWDCELGGFLEEIGLRRGLASTCLYSEDARGISASVHGDDVTVKASREDAD